MSAGRSGGSAVVAWCSCSGLNCAWCLPALQKGPRQDEHLPSFLSANGNGIHALCWHVCGTSDLRSGGNARCLSPDPSPALPPLRQVTWYLVSDSTALRKAAVEKYGSKILTAVNAPLGHISQVPFRPLPAIVHRTWV